MVPVESASDVTGPGPTDSPLQSLSLERVFAGREAELQALRRRFDQAVAGSGGLVTVAGEPGIGKTRIVQEFAEHAREAGAVVLWGRCYEGDWAPPYGPWVEALSAYVRSVEPDQLARELGPGAPPIARLVPAVAAVLPDVSPPASLSPDEERFRLYDAVTQLLLAAARTRPVVLVLDDLHWADRDSVGLLRHVARFAVTAPLLIVGNYRDVDLDRRHPLAEALTTLRRERGFERILLRGLGREQVQGMLDELAGHAVAAPFVDVLYRETEGNPFFLGEVLLNLQEEGVIERRDGLWVSTVGGVEHMSIPEGVRDVVGKRLSRLSEETNRVLGLASVFTGGFRFAVLAELAKLDEERLLDCIDEALAAQLLRTADGRSETYDFVHALIRRTLYDELSASRRVRLHRQIAEALERVYMGASGGEGGSGDTGTADAFQGEPAGPAGARVATVVDDLAYHYHESAAIAGAERGVRYALLAAERAEARAAWEQTVTMLRWALELLPEGDPRRARLLARLALALAWLLEFEEAASTARHAAALIAADEGDTAAAIYLRDVAVALGQAGSVRAAWSLAADGLRYAGDRRDVPWAYFKTLDLDRRDAEDPAYIGLVVATPEREAVWQITDGQPVDVGGMNLYRPYASAAGIRLRLPVLERAGDDFQLSVIKTFLLGEYREALAIWEALAARNEAEGRINEAGANLAQVARCQLVLGHLGAAESAYARGVALSKRVPGVSNAAIQLGGYRAERCLMLDVGWEVWLAELQSSMADGAPERAWVQAVVGALTMAALARLGRADEALALFPAVLPALDRAPVGVGNYQSLACSMAASLWLLGRTDHIETIEQNIKRGVVDPGFHHPMRNGALSLGWLAALQGRMEEAQGWFKRAREELETQGCRPLRATVDYDEALALQRAGSPDLTRIGSLLGAAGAQFRSLGMTGWVTRARALEEALSA
ncbi:MAG TPA: AAA family ATPase [Chloroflexota bacterium]